MWALLAILGVAIAIGAPAAYWLRMTTQAGAATDTGRRGQFLEGIVAATNIGTARQAVREPDGGRRRVEEAEGREA